MNRQNPLQRPSFKMASKSRIMISLIQSMHLLDDLLQQKIPTREIWEQELVELGIVPRLIPLQCVSNDRYLYLDSRGKCVEWNILCLTGLRLYWKRLLQQVGAGEERDKLCGSFRWLAWLLPGEKVRCVHCDWWVPKTELYTEDSCSYCHLRHVAQLRYRHQIPYVHIPHSTNVTKTISPTSKTQSFSVCNQNVQ